MAKCCRSTRPRSTVDAPVWPANHPLAAVDGRRRVQLCPEVRTHATNPRAYLRQTKAGVAPIADLDNMVHSRSDGSTSWRRPTRAVSTITAADRRILTADTGPFAAMDRNAAWDGTPPATPASVSNPFLRLRGYARGSRAPSDHRRTESDTRSWSSSDFGGRSLHGPERPNRTALRRPEPRCAPRLPTGSASDPAGGASRADRGSLSRVSLLILLAARRIAFAEARSALNLLCPHRTSAGRAWRGGNTQRLRFDAIAKLPTAKAGRRWGAFARFLTAIPIDETSPRAGSERRREARRPAPHARGAIRPHADRLAPGGAALRVRKGRAGRRAAAPDLAARGKVAGPSAAHG